MAREILRLVHVDSSTWIVPHGVERLAHLRIERVEERLFPGE